MKKEVTTLILACLIMACAASGCGKASSSDTETTTAEATTAAIAFKEMEFRSMTYEVPKSWALNTVTDTSTNSLDTGSSDSLLMIMYSDTNGEAVTASYLKNTAEAVKLAYEDCTVLDEGAIIIDYNPAYKMEMTLTSNGEQYFWEQYMFGNSSDLYTVVFSSKGTSRSSTMDLYEDEIVNSIQLSETATEKATEEPTTEEPTTEEPTTEEPTTEKPTEAKDTIVNNTSTGGFSAQGTGDYVAEGLTVTGYGVLKINHTGSGNFAVISYEGDDYDNLLVNTIGNYSGEVLIDHSGTFSLEITADGSWSITSSGLSIDDSTSFSGTGDAVTGITTHDGGTWEISNSGDGNFAVIQYGLSEGYMDLLVNEIGDYSGTVKGESGDDIFFEVTSEGNWSISKK